MASSVQIYTVEVAGGGGAAPGDGFIDPIRMESYKPALETTPSGMTLATCQAKRRGNLRWAEVINQLGMVTNVYVLPQTIVSDGTATTAPSSVKFSMMVQYGDDALCTGDELNPGVILTGMDCIKRCIARGLSADLHKQTDVYDPTSVAGAWGGGSASVPRYGTRIDTGFKVGPCAASLTAAEGLVTVSKI